MVHRSTFYAHFEDKRHLLTFGMQAFLDDLTDGMPCSDNPAPFRQAIEKVFQYFLARRQEYARLFLDPATPKPRRFSGRSLPECSPSRPCTTPPSLPTPGRRSWCSANSLPGAAVFDHLVAEARYPAFGGGGGRGFLQRLHLHAPIPVPEASQDTPAPQT